MDNSMVRDISNEVEDHHCEFKCSGCGGELMEFWADEPIKFCPFCGWEIERGVKLDG